MKSVGPFLILGREETRLPLDPSFVTALGLREGVVLYGVMVQSESPPQVQASGTGPRSMTLIATPFPEGSWPRLIRMSVRIEPRIGALHSLVSSLRELGIFPRHLEDVTGNSATTPAIVPSATLVLELPRPEVTGGAADPLHLLLREVIKDATKSAEAIRPFQEALAAKSKREVAVQWISPMATLNRLAAQGRVEKLWVANSMPQSSASASLEVSSLPWRRLLWPPSPVPPYHEVRAGSDDKKLVMTSMDSDEKVVAWYFYPYANCLAVQFEITTPAFALEHLWWEYIYDCVQEAKGSVLSSDSSARINGRWSVLRCAAMFPVDPSEGEAEDPRPIVHCFRKLQGDRSSTTAFAELRNRLKALQGLIGPQILDADAEKNWREEGEPSFSSQLERLVVWDPTEDGSTHRFPGRFARNPFRFTLPLGLGEYETLYGDALASVYQSRLQVARSIQEKLLGDVGENVVIVGAHRTGKSTVLNLVYGLLDRSLRSESAVAATDVRLFPVKITASVTPPHMLFSAILDQLGRIEGRHIARIIRESRNRIMKLAGAVLRHFEVGFPPVTVTGRTIAEKLTEMARRGDSSEQMLRSFGERLDEDRGGLLPEFLALSLRALRDALRAVNENVRLVVVMDELGDSTGWGDPRTLAVWRHAIESGEFSQIRWLFSTTRPVRETAKYSPITNVFFEINVGSLGKAESQSLVDAFSFAAWKAQEDEENAELRPVITFPARSFLIGVTSALPYLLQVACYHIYDRATRTAFPLINKALCRKAILEKVLPELADYLEHQWRQVPDAAQRVIVESLESMNRELRDPDAFLHRYENWQIDVGRMPPDSLKALDRSGLRGDDGRCVAPIVGAWLLHEPGKRASLK